MLFVQFEPTILVQDALRIIDEKVPQATEGESKLMNIYLLHNGGEPTVYHEGGSKLMNIYLLHNGGGQQYIMRVKVS